MEVDEREHVDEEKAPTKKLAAVWLISPHWVTITSFTGLKHMKIQPASGLRTLDAIFCWPRTFLWSRVRVQSLSSCFDNSMFRASFESKKG